jgi:colicin import membrane protein
LTLLVLHQSNNIIIPSPYIVSLVAPPDNKQEASKNVTDKSAADMKRTSLLDEKESSRIEKSKKTEQKRVEDSINKLKAIENLKRNKKLRDIVMLKTSNEQNIKRPSNQAVNYNTSKGSLFDSYYGKITNEIRKEWVYPDIGEKNLQAIIFVKIMRDGTIKVQGIEKSSGNALFDRSAQRAIAKATPVTPPPYEMEIGIRFYP